MSCPVCRARWRGSRTCSRCGADLAPLMRLVAAAHGQRQAARRALAAGDPGAARRQADAAQALHVTPAGRGLAVLAAWLEARGEQDDPSPGGRG